MDPALSHSSPPSISRVLIVENNFSTVEPLIDVFRDRRVDVDFHLCTSHRSAARKLLESPYQLIISGTHLAEMEEFFLLKAAQALHTFAPLVVTANSSNQQETASARQVLEQGAFDFISLPPESEQTVRTILLALWLNKLRALIASREQVMEKYRQHVGDYPGDKETDESFHRSLSVVQETVSVAERTFQAIEKCLVRISDFAMKVEDQARKRALGRLTAMPK